MQITLDQYRAHRHLMVNGPDGIRAYRVGGDLVRHCELHREMQQSLVRLRAALVR
jgi:hypothetical protein